MATERSQFAESARIHTIHMNNHTREAAGLGKDWVQGNVLHIAQVSVLRNK